MRIAVLLGGTSPERDVSVVSGVTIARALEESGHEVVAIDCAMGAKEVDFHQVDVAHLIQLTPSQVEQHRLEWNRNLLQTLQYLLKENFDVVFNALHGGYGENGQVQAIMDILEIPYTGSDYMASMLGMNKHLAKLVFQSRGVPTSPWLYFTSPQQVDVEKILELGLPVVVKPNDQGSTVGLTVVRKREEIHAAVTEAFRYSTSILVEKYIPGKEITAAILGNEPLPLIEIKPRSGLYDYAAKYQHGLTEYEVPAKLPAELTRQIQEKSLEAYLSLGCRDYGRVDLRLQEDGQFFCLEVNTLPGMTPTSLVPKAAKAVGISFPELVDRIAKMAWQRAQKSK